MQVYGYFDEDRYSHLLAKGQFVLIIKEGRNKKKLEGTVVKKSNSTGY